MDLETSTSTWLDEWSEKADALCRHPKDDLERSQGDFVEYLTQGLLKHLDQQHHSVINSLVDSPNWPSATPSKFASPPHARVCEAQAASLAQGLRPSEVSSEAWLTLGAA